MTTTVKEKEKKKLSPLEEMGYPLYWIAKNAKEAGFEAPPKRRDQSVRAWIRSLTVTQKEALVYNAATGTAWRLASDEGTYLNGDDIAPNPLTFLSCGMVASYMAEITALAEQRGIDLADIEMVLDNYYYREGDFKQGTMRSGALAPELEVRCKSDADRETLMQLFYDGVAASPLNGLTRGSHESLFTLQHNGQTLEPAQVRHLGDDPLADPGDNFPKLERLEDPDVVQPVIEKLTPEAEMTEWVKKNPQEGPPVEEGQTGMHMRAYCRLRPDGVKEIVKEQYAPVATTWKFLSDEQGRAPDAATYISAGIGFCFMTQMERYARMAKLPMSAHRIIQDTHFSLGGATGKTGKAGEADPVETHVYIDSDGEDSVAQEILGVGERTCFLHAFCKTDLKTRVTFKKI